MTTAVHRIHNFSAGPCTLPLEVLEEAQAQLINYQDMGMSLVEMSHRTRPVIAVFEEATALLREMLAVPETHHVLFLQGGATLHSGLIPANLLAGGRSADYVHSGAWAKKSIEDARAVGQVNLVFDGKDSNYMTLPDPASVACSEQAVYLHLTSNETIGGLQWKDFPTVDKPIVADMSSDILSRRLPMEKFGIIYAGTQKNLAPAGCALVIIRDDVLKQCPGNLPNYMNYAAHVRGESMLNTPPVFQVWMIQLVLRWLKAHGGMVWAEQMAAKRSGLLYDAIERHAGFYACPVDSKYRSTMNVVFTTPSEELDAKFVKEAEAAGLSGLKGHRSVGGCRASVYNAMPVEGVGVLADFMDSFAQANG